MVQAVHMSNTDCALYAGFGTCFFLFRSLCLSKTEGMGKRGRAKGKTIKMVCIFELYWIHHYRYVLPPESEVVIARTFMLC